jgi:4a-hydroxytetrahydrobiopterin dehydratase
MTQPLNRDDLSTALLSLEGWEERDDRLVRTVPVPSDSHDAFVESVRTTAGDDADIVRTGDAVTVRLGSGGVSAADVELAARLDQVLSGASWDAGSTR